MRRKALTALTALALLAALAALAVACVPSDPSGGGNGASFETISPEEAKALMDSESGYVILDVREQSEYDEGHIAGAVLLPYTEIDRRAPEMLPDKGRLILVYCRSGRRSAIAARALADAGYARVKDFGGINAWKYGTVKQES